MTINSIKEGREPSAPSQEVIAAAQWLAEQAVAPQQVIHVLRQRFGITAAQACDACRRADQMRLCRRAFG